MIRDLRTLLAGVSSSRDLIALAHELMLGQWIGEAVDQAEGALDEAPPESVEVVA